MKLQTKVVTPWRRVPKPVMKAPSVSMLTSKPPAPPKVSPKPGSKVYLYVYDSEPENPTAAPQYYQNPHFVQQPASDQAVKYPYAKEKEAREDAARGRAPRKSGKERVRSQGQKSDKGYKVLAEVTPQLRSSSRGGKMFIKQKQRMEKFTKESQNFVQDDEEMNRKNKDYQGATDRWATPWNMATKSPTAVKYITAKRLPEPMHRGAKFRDPTGFLPKPPELWRSKVEQDFPKNGPRPPLYKPVSPYWHSVSQGRSATPTGTLNGTLIRRPDSAPPLDSPTYYEDQNVNPLNDIYSENNNDGYFSEYDEPRRPASVALPSATIHFNAKHYYNAPHRRQGLRRGAQIYTTTPYAQRDFNARAKGWNRYY